MSTTTANAISIPREEAKPDVKPAPIPAPAPAVTATDPADAPTSLFARYKKPVFIAAGLVAAVVIAYYVYDSYTHEETDDAYVTGHLHEVSSRLNEVVTGVFVDDNQLVKKGQLLVQLDSDEYRALVAAAQANLKKAQADLDREKPLVALHAETQQNLDASQCTRDVVLSQLGLAELQVQYTSIVAPADGYVGRKNVEVGNRVSSGQTLMVIVEPDLWIVANFKETQLAHMKPGQRVRITIDEVPDKVFTGKVDSFSPATGNEFALLPADNSTGNFTKIVQRVPVKIVFDPDSIRGYEKRIRAGLSVVVKVTL
jgi:membrane fusion protein (multidrug efflux system)